MTIKDAFKSLGSEIKGYFKAKWDTLKEILVRKGKEMWAIIKNKARAMWDSLVSHTKDLMNKLWTKVGETWTEIKLKVLQKELAFFEKIGDWFFAKADGVVNKLKEYIETWGEDVGDIIDDSDSEPEPLVDEPIE